MPPYDVAALSIRPSALGPVGHPLHVHRWLTVFPLLEAGDRAGKETKLPAGSAWGLLGR